MIEAGHDASHVRAHHLERAGDHKIFEFAKARGLIIISEDTDFGEILARAGEESPSLVLIRSAEPLTPDDQAELIQANIPSLESDLMKGAVVVLGKGRVRVRPLPIYPPR